MTLPDSDRNVLVRIDCKGGASYWHIDAYVRWDNGNEGWLDEDEECVYVDWVDLPRHNEETGKWTF